MSSLHCFVGCLPLFGCGIFPPGLPEVPGNLSSSAPRCARLRASLCVGFTIGALIIKNRVLGFFYYDYNKVPPNGIGNFLGPYTRACTRKTNFKTRRNHQWFMMAVATVPAVAKSWESEKASVLTSGGPMLALWACGVLRCGASKEKSSERLVGFLPKLPQLVSFWLRSRADDFASIPMPTPLRMSLCARYGTGANPKQWHGLASSKRPRSFRSPAWVAGHGVVVGTEHPRHRRWRGCQAGHSSLCTCGNLCKL